jgi:hypothetical protein
MQPVKDYPTWKKNGNVVHHVDPDGLRAYRKHKRSIETKDQRIQQLETQVKELQVWMDRINNLLVTNQKLKV